MCKNIIRHRSLNLVITELDELEIGDEKDKLSISLEISDAYKTTFTCFLVDLRTSLISNEYDIFAADIKV